ncbi:MAG TPA: MBL fold metallo-hydrolase [Oligoflexia bacterium]|nr:MBL fold metallo-hydrolase [Oligoflexia bacterium]
MRHQNPQPCIQFLGGVGTVTGSKFLVSLGSEKILIDCGLFQGLKELRLQNWAEFPIDPRSITAVVLTHAHLDHSGYLPLLVKKGFAGKIYCTPPTRDLSKIILEDSAEIQEEDADYANKKGYSKHDPAKPLYTIEDVRRSLRHFTVVPNSDWFKINDRIKFRFKPNGHILGSAFIELKIGTTKITFSGDMGRKNPIILNPSSSPEKTDFLIVESTYGDRLHPNLSPARELKRIINETLARKGKLIIPSFAVGRAQDLLHLLSQLRAQNDIPNVPIYLDSPMGIHATDIFMAHSKWHKLKNNEVDALGRIAVMVRKQRNSIEIAEKKQSSIIIAGSGMLSGGRVLHHLEKCLPDERNTVLIVGFQAASTRGRLLKEGIPELKIHGKYIPVHARIEEISGLSAHGDQKEILDWLKQFKTAPKNTFIVHGEPQASDALRVCIQDRLGWNCTIPKPFDHFILPN